MFLLNKYDILSLLFYCDIDFKDYLNRLKELKKKEFYDRLIKIVKDFQEYKYFDFTPRELKMKKNELLNKLKRG